MREPCEVDEAIAPLLEMFPRAAWRLESLGFGEVYDYTVGKLDWMAAGLPTESTNAKRSRAGDLAHKDTPACGLKERLAEVSDRVRSVGWEAVVVVNEEGIVFGLLRTKELDADGDQLIEQVMRPGLARSGPSSRRGDGEIPVGAQSRERTHHHIRWSLGRTAAAEGPGQPGCRVLMSRVDIRTKKCTKCGRHIEVCAGCYEPACQAAICGDCLRITVGQSMRQPHVHGG